MCLVAPSFEIRRLKLKTCHSCRSEQRSGGLFSFCYLFNPINSSLGLCLPNPIGGYWIAPLVVSEGIWPLSLIVDDVDDSCCPSVSVPCDWKES